MQRMLTVLIALAPISALAQGQQHRHHPVADMPLHEKCYSTWYMPDNPNKSCYPTEISYRDGAIFAKRREDGKWLRVPAAKVENNRNNPDGRNHLCAPPPNASYPVDTVFCFALGGGT